MPSGLQEASLSPASKWDLHSSLTGSFSKAVILKDKLSNFCCIVISVYGPSEDSLRLNFWDELTSIRQSFSGPCCFVGDFNVIRFAEEYSRIRRTTHAMQSFSDWIQDQELVDLPLAGAKFTWTNGRKSQIQSRLDRFLLSTDWIEEFPSVNQIALPRTTSDHCPILLSVVDVNWGPKPFKFNSAWLGINGFKQKIVEWWPSPQVDGFASHRLCCRLRFIKEKLKEWKEEEYWKREIETEALFAEFHQIDSSVEGKDLPMDVLSRRIHIIQSLSSRSLEDELSWRLKSRTRWISEGDKNTKYFHCMANMRAWTKAILSISKDSIQVDDRDEISEIAVVHFRSVLSSEGWPRPRLHGIPFLSL
ncbi:uncharacterized protein LOC131223951 [Magnolia sinica]|uniref:uncharacterized protein LOC131223951 n=1 Tax=Magnolia sinica TaxID=86752 RepID=UPI00265B1393|nr:uncharacterized protein LOC131223951 [Magnolia sinica]